MMSKCLFIVFVFPYFLFGQKTFNSDDYFFISPSDFTFSRDILVDGYIDILTVKEIDSLESPKYLIYLHKTNIGSTIDAEYLVSNPEQYTSDLKCQVINSSSVKYNGYEGLELNVRFNGYEEIVGYIFMTTYKSTLRRVIFMIPSDEYHNRYIEEVKGVLNTLKLQ